ncbi:MAG: 3-methyl-2-oxobutanoate hydroxymethyltransferase [Candidatus Omnitrophica bacterium]|nr:3-methyl-2-oxobutanoate hydroxymethyltransferase [Candidatus Omnitrophota bacterium]
MKKLTIQDVQKKKVQQQKITMLTAYDFPMAQLLDQAGIDIVLVGDSLANVVQGLTSTKDVTFEDMLYHSQLVRRAVKRALVVGDMPFISYQVDTQNAVIHAKHFIEDARCDAVKVEWFDRCLDVVRDLRAENIPVMGHVGLTPQTVENPAGFKVQGKDFSSAIKIIDQAQQLQGQGCFALVLECVPAELAKMITEQLDIPTIGIGAGAHCDGQVLVTNDLLGLTQGHKPKFVKRYVDLHAIMLETVHSFRAEVLNGIYPDREHSYSMKDDEWNRILKSTR